MRLRGKGGAGAGIVIAVAGVALALMIMEFTLAIVVGFKDGIRNKLIGFDAQISVKAAVDDPDEILHLTPELLATVRGTLPETDLSLTLRQPALLKTDNDFHGLVLVGRDPASDFSFEKSNIVEGAWPDYSADSCANAIVISRAVASQLELKLGDRAFSTFFVDDNVKVRPSRVAAIYESNFGEYDSNVAYASLRTLQRVAGIDSVSGTSLDIRGIDIDYIASEADRLQQALVDDAVRGRLDQFYPVDNVTRTGALYFNWLALLDTNVIVIFVLMLAVASLTLISSLFILILERVNLIGILRAMGMQKKGIRDIFVDLAMRLVGLGMIIGNVLAIALLLIQKHFEIIPLNPQMYYLSSVPVEINWWAFAALNVGTIFVAWLVLVLPARMAANLDPIKAVSYD